MYNYEDSILYGEDRCCNSIVTLGGEPNWFLCWNGSDGIRGRHTLTGNEKFFKIEDFDPTPVHIGYVNLNTTCYYISRVPFRQWKQGLRSANMATLYEDNMMYCGVDEILLRSEGFCQAYKNKYPSLESILSSNDMKLRAFSHEYCVKRSDEGLLLLRRQIKVGTIDEDSARIELFKDYKYLQDEMEEVLNETA